MHKGELHGFLRRNSSAAALQSAPTWRKLEAEKAAAISYPSAPSHSKKLAKRGSDWSMQQDSPYRRRLARWPTRPRNSLLFLAPLSETPSATGSDYSPRYSLLPSLCKL